MTRLHRSGESDEPAEKMIFRFDVSYLDSTSGPRSMMRVSIVGTTTRLSHLYWATSLIAVLRIELSMHDDGLAEAPNARANCETPVPWKAGAAIIMVCPRRNGTRSRELCPTREGRCGHAAHPWEFPLCRWLRRTKPPFFSGAGTDDVVRPAMASSRVAAVEPSAAVPSGQER